MIAEAIGAACALLAAGSVVISLAGMVLSRDPYARLLYGSIPSGCTTFFVALGAAFAFGPGIVSFQMVAFVLLMTISGAVAGHRIAAAAAHRQSLREKRE